MEDGGSRLEVRSLSSILNLLFCTAAVAGRTERCSKKGVKQNSCKKTYQTKWRQDER